MKESIYTLKTRVYPKPTRWLWVYIYIFFPFVFLVAILALSNQATVLYDLYEDSEWGIVEIVNDDVDRLRDYTYRARMSAARNSLSRNSFDSWREYGDAVQEAYENTYKYILLDDLTDYDAPSITYVYIQTIVLDVCILLNALFAFLFALIVFLQIRKLSNRGFRLNQFFLWYFAISTLAINAIYFYQGNWEIGIIVGNVISSFLFVFFNIIYFKNRQDLFSSEYFQPAPSEPSPAAPPAPEESPALYCHKCGVRLPEESVYCPRCGAKIG